MTVTLSVKYEKYIISASFREMLQRMKLIHKPYFPHSSSLES